MPELCRQSSHVEKKVPMSIAWVMPGDTRGRGGKQPDWSNDREFSQSEYIFSVIQVLMQYLHPINQIKSERTKRGERQAFVVSQVIGTIN